MSRILIITTGLRAKSNSDFLAEQVADGAKATEHQAGMRNSMKHMNLVRSCSKVVALLFCLFSIFSAIMASDIPTAEAEERNLKEELLLSIDGIQVEVDWEENESVAALRELVALNSLTIQLSMYGGFEQVGPLGTSLPRHDMQTNTNYGDIVLYSGNQIVIFHGSNSWAYTRLGHIPDLSQAALKKMLGQHDVTIRLTLSAKEEGHAIPDVTLNSGYTMPIIGLGTWTLSDDQAEVSVYGSM